MLSSTKNHFLHLPDDIVRLIAEYLDSVSLCSLLDACPGFLTLFRSSRLLERIKAKHLSYPIFRLLVPVVLDIRVLDLSNCWYSWPALMIQLISSCKLLSQLNVVNSVLAAENVLDAIKELRELREISFSTVRAKPRGLCSAVFPSIQRVNVECSVNSDEWAFTSSFLKACPNARVLHINIVGHGLPENLSRLHVNGTILKKYDGVILSAYTQPSPDIAKLALGFIFKVFRNDISSAHPGNIYCYERSPAEEGEDDATSLIQSHRRLYLERENPNGNLEIPDSYRYGRMTALWMRASRQIRRHVKMPRMEALSSLVELDVLDCHLEYSSGFWPSLIQSSPAIEALALPQCSLLKTGLRAGREIPALIEETMEALRQMKLKKLYVSACNSCFRYPGSSRRFGGGFLKFLADLQHLEEFTLHGAGIDPDFFDLIGDRQTFPMRTVKLKVFLNLDGMRGLESFVRSCTSLRNLKLEALSLPIRSGWFWDAVIAANLNQLCLSSASGVPIDTQMLKEKLSHLSKSLDVFHLHAQGLQNSEEVTTVLVEEMKAANLHRTRDFIACMGVDWPSIAKNEDFTETTFPGRALCGMQNHIGKPKPVGWDID